ncbi:MAG: diguanylate cyclase [Burkholderiales bacterium]
MLESLLFGRDDKQAIRIGRLLIATSVYFFAIFFVYCSTSAGMMPAAHSQEVLAAALLVNLLFYLAIRFDFNLRFRDSSLTIPQMTLGMLANSYLLYHGGPARPAILIGFLIILAFGTLKLRPRHILQVGALPAVIYGGMIGYDFVWHRGEGNLMVEILQWLVLLFVSPWFALIAGHVAGSRRKLRESRERLETVTREHEVALKNIQEQATRDELTGLYNRRYMAGALRQERSRTDRTHEPFCVLMLDVDHFKRINDGVGHIAGDNVLIAVTAAIAPQLRAIDHFSRHGGEEFLVVMPSTSLDAAMHAAERIRKCIEETPIEEAGVKLRVTLSIGVAEYRAGGSIDATLADVDRALYRAKHNGRNCVEFSRTPVATSLGVRTA